MSLLSSIAPSLNRAPKSARESSRDLGATMKPAHELTETAEGFALTVYLPGIEHSGLEIQADAENLNIVGRRTWKRPDDWTCLYRESDDSAYELVLAHDNIVDLDKIQAELRDGVLRVALAKTEAVKPRKIAVK